MNNIVKYYCIYRITNTVNGKIYIGCHQTDDIDDGYMGSGWMIKAAIKKYGIHVFKKEILCFCVSREEMLYIENNLVNQEFVEQENNYNLKIGGEGGWHYNCQMRNDPKYREKWLASISAASKRVWKNDEYRKNMIAKISASNKKAYEEGKRKRKPVCTFKGKHHTAEFRERIGIITSKCQKGKGNSQYGKCWINNLILKQNKRIKKEELDTWLQQGWVKGRKMKFR